MPTPRVTKFLTKVSITISGELLDRARALYQGHHMSATFEEFIQTTLAAAFAAPYSADVMMQEARHAAFNTVAKTARNRLTYLLKEAEHDLFREPTESAAIVHRFSRGVSTTTMPPPPLSAMKKENP